MYMYYVSKKKILYRILSIGLIILIGVFSVASIPNDKTENSQVNNMDEVNNTDTINIMDDEIPISGDIDIELDTPENVDGAMDDSIEVVTSTEKPEDNKPETELPDIEDSKPEVTVTPTPMPEDTLETTFAEQVVKLVNQERIKAGLNEVTLDKTIENAALIRAKEITQSFSHTRPNGSNFSTVLKEQGITYKGAGENIAWGQNSPEEVMKAWMNSQGHRANILNPNFTKIGVGHYQNAKGTNYWAQLFTY